MLSQKFVFHKSKNFTSDNEIRMPPTVPFNHYTTLAEARKNSRNQQKTRIRVLFHYPMLIVFIATNNYACLEHSNLLKVKELDF